MATFYEFAVSAFSNGLDVEALGDELRYDFDFGANLNGVSADASLCRVDFTVDLNSAQEDTLNEAVAAHPGTAKPFVKKHYEQEFDRTRLIRETWWARSSGDVLSVKVEETLYTYSGSRLVTEQFKQYNRDGSVEQTRNWILRQEKVGTSLRVRKMEQ